MISTKTFGGITIILASLNAVICEKELCNPWERVEIQNAVIFPNGSLWDPEGSSLYFKSSYWKERGENETFKIYGCPCMLKNRPCIRKCCGREEAMDFQDLKCIAHEAKSSWFRPNVTVNEDGRFQQVEEGHFVLVFGNFCLGYLLEPSVYPQDYFYVNLIDGKLFIPSHNSSGLGSENYCLEYFPEVESYLPYVCFEPKEYKIDTCESLSYVSYPIAMVISSIFLLISISVYSVIPELRNLQGKCLMCHMTSLLCAFVFLASVQGLGSRLYDETCVVFGFVIYFSLLCTFFWINVMSIHIYVAIRSSQPITTSNKNSETRKFLLYASYAFGFPLVMTFIAAILELHPQVSDDLIKPEFVLSCWFHSDMAKMVYFTVPVGVIVLCNICLFVLSAYNAYKLNKEAQNTTTESRGRNTREESKRMFKVYLVLFVIMGVNWAMEIISSSVGGSQCIWYIPDLLNTLQGIYFFFIFVWRKKVWRLLLERCCGHHIVSKDDDIVSISDSSTNTHTSANNMTSSQGNNLKLKNVMPKSNCSGVDDEQ